MIKEKGTGTCYYLLSIYEPQTIIYICIYIYIYIPRDSLFSMMSTIYPLSNLVQFSNSFCVPFYSQFHVIRGFDCNT